ncbi:kelch repeat and BTB domain-containing protein 12 [Bicyclus anynana]|uniref:Kelch repeat and BTB domain-containing protein 12 n=1 Tax=Bicyclus anynana TaxID=110368 RepID=A0A6J1NK23_BICAN|nr:kelch repeat and BTB domain-containing protein 12 [Bicyclus anynana]
MGYKVIELGRNNLYDRVNKLLVSCEWSDCSFSVCGKKLKAHKLILGVSSPVFEAMFYGPLSTNDDIIITDIEPSIFQLLLNYIYTDKLDIDSIEEAYDVLYASRKYMLENLTDICISYIQSNMDIDNVITVLNYPEYIQDNQLVLSALKLFCQHADYLLKENKKYISLTCMQKILNCNEMNISEKDLIQEVFEWTKHYCDQNNVESDFQNRRDVLIKCGLLKKLRLFTLSMADIEEIKGCQYNLLIHDEIDDLKQVVRGSGIMTNKVISTFDTKIIPRNALKLHWCLCHRAPIRSESPIVVDPVYNSTVHTRVRANKSTFINSLNVQSRMAPVCNQFNTNVYFEQFTISVTCELSKKIISTFNFKRNIEYDSNIEVKFIKPLLFKKNLWYNISIKWPQLNRYSLYAVESRDSGYNNGKIKFEFEDLTKNGGSFLRAVKFCI